MKLAMLQILLLAPSMRPDIELVVSRAKTTSTWGRRSGAAMAGISAGARVTGGWRKVGAGGAVSKAMARPGIARRAPSAANTVTVAAARIDQVIQRLPRGVGVFAVVSGPCSVVASVVLVSTAGASLSRCQR